MAYAARVDVFCYRYPLARPLETVFGRVEARPALIVRVEDDEGAAGWGEIWCNFPQVGAEYRARLAAAVAPAALAGMNAAEPNGAFQTIRARIHGLALQAGEPGPADQIAAGFDIALHDLAARRAGMALASFLGGAPQALEVYASGIDARLAREMIPAARAAGYRAFKLRVGFGDRNARDVLAGARAAMGAGDRLMVDANQAWTVEQALDAVRDLGEAGLEWIEEPLAVDRPVAEWARVASASRAPLAGGENMRSEAEFEAAISGSIFGVIQPDVCKWGGLSACVPLARRIIAGGKRYCPHYLGGGVGLAASAHLLSAVGGDGLLEIDCNDNQLRERLAGSLLPLVDHHVQVPQGPGLGYTPDIGSVRDLLAWHGEVAVRSP